eukprot:scaffold60385_cov18-Tisochrysis_lutea.AAC.1
MQPLSPHRPSLTSVRERSPHPQEIHNCVLLHCRSTPMPSSFTMPLSRLPLRAYPHWTTAIKLQHAPHSCSS